MGGGRVWIGSGGTREGVQIGSGGRRDVVVRIGLGPNVCLLLTGWVELHTYC